MRVVITGAGGRLGRRLVERWAEIGDQVVALDRHALDVAEEPAVWAAVGDYAPEVVVNAAALAEPEACEADPERAWRVNAGGPRHLAAACGSAGAFLVQVSTAEVFGSGAGPWTEFDPPRPASTLARSKEAGEQLVRLLCPAHAVVRAGWVVDPGEGLLADAAAAARAGEELALTDGPLGSPTPLEDLAAALRHVAAARRAGTFHVAGEGGCTERELAAAAAELAGAGELRVRVVDARTGGWAARPADARLEARHAALAGVPPVGPWRQALARALGG